jgi:hypothetical protein
MNNFSRNLVCLTFGCLAVQAAAQEPSFLQWNIQMSTPRLMSGAVVNLKNLNRAELVAYTLQAKVDVISPGVNLHWEKKPFPDYTDIRFEIQAPGQVGPAPGPITGMNDVAIRVGSRSTTHGGYLVHTGMKFGIDMNFSRTPSYEWRVISLTKDATGITRTHKVALLNTKKKAFLVFQSRRVGFEVGWWEYVGPSEKARVGPIRTYTPAKTNIGELLSFLKALRAINVHQERFVRRILGVKYEHL